MSAKLRLFLFGLTVFTLVGCEADEPLFRDLDAAAPTADGGESDSFAGSDATSVDANGDAFSRDVASDVAAKPAGVCEVALPPAECKAFTACNVPGQFVFGQAASLPGFSCRDVCEAFGLTCLAREAQAAYTTACQAKEPVVMGTCAYTFTSASVSQCRCHRL